MFSSVPLCGASEVFLGAVQGKVRIYKRRSDDERDFGKGKAA